MTDKHIAVLPTYNEADHIEEVIGGIEETGIIDEVVIVDDASTDETVAVIEQTDAILVQNQRNLNKGGAIKRGYDTALELGADLIYRLDGDGQHHPDDLGRFYEALCSSDCRYVLGNRFGDPEYRKAMPTIRTIGNRVIAVATSVRLGTVIHDPTCGYRAMDARTLERVPYDQYSNDYKFGVEELFAFSYVGGDIVEVDVNCIYDDEESTLTYWDGLRYLYPSVTWWNLKKDYSAREHDQSHR